MVLDYDKAILRALYRAGEEGLSVGCTTHRVFNSLNDFFCPLSYEEVYRYVSRYLVHNSHNPDSLIEKTAQRGVYHLNFHSSETRQLMLQFDDCEAEEENHEAEDTQNQPSLFD